MRYAQYLLPTLKETPGDAGRRVRGEPRIVPRALDVARLGDGPLTRLTEVELAQVERGLKAVLGLL